MSREGSHPSKRCPRTLVGMRVQRTYSSPSRLWMPAGRSTRRILTGFYVVGWLIVVVTAVACSGARQPEARQSISAAPRSDSWLCASSPQVVSLEAFGVPTVDQPIDIALGPEKVTVLLRPARLVTLQRRNPRAVDMIVGTSSESWRAIDRDPMDGSLWIASSETVSLLRIAETGERRLVSGPRVEGQGGFTQIRIGPDAIYATPTGTANAVWRLSREGKLLSQSFPRAVREESDIRIAGDTAGAFFLARNLEGSVVGFDLLSGQFYRSKSGGSWELLPDRFPARSASHARSLHGEAVGTSAESWFFSDEIHGFLYLPGGPVLIGGAAQGLRIGNNGTVLFRMRDDRIQTAIENCIHNGPLIAVSDSMGFAAVSTGNYAVIDRSGARSAFPHEVILGRFREGTW